MKSDDAMSRAQAPFWNCNGMKLCNRKFPSAVQFENNFLRWFSSWWLILSLVIHEKRLFLISDTGGSEEKVRVEPVTSFLKIILLHQQRKYQSDSIRSAVRSDPDFVEGLPLPKNLFTTDVPFSRKYLASPLIQNSPFQSILYSPILPTRSSEYRVQLGGLNAEHVLKSI